MPEPRPDTKAKRHADSPRSWSVSLPVEPVAKARPRISPAEYERVAGERVKVRGAHGYTEDKTAQFETTVRWLLRAKKIPVLEGDLEVEIQFWYTPVSRKPRGHDDLDNYVKALFDATNGIGWNDDRQVVHIDAGLYKITAGLAPHITFSARVV